MSTYKHITVQLPAVPASGKDFCKPEELFQQSPEALAEQRVAMAAPGMLAALKLALNAMVHVELSDSSRQEWQAAKDFAQATIAQVEGTS